jgi:hypothetical protein
MTQSMVIVSCEQRRIWQEAIVAHFKGTFCFRLDVLRITKKIPEKAADKFSSRDWKKQVQK